MNNTKEIIDALKEGKSKSEIDQIKRRQKTDRKVRNIRLLQKIIEGEK